jgi:hypothetical protein
MIFTRDDRVLEALGRPDHLLQDAVHAEAHADVLLLRLDVDVARPLLRGAEEERVDEADDGSLVARIEQVLGLFQLVRDGVETARLHVADVLLGFVGRAVVDEVDAVEDRLRRHEQRHDRRVEEEPHAVERARVERIGERDDRLTLAVALDAQGKEPRLLGEVDRDELDQIQRHLFRREPHLVWQLELGGERLQDLLFVASLQRDERIAEPAPALRLHVEGLVDLVRRDDALGDEDFPQRAASEIDDRLGEPQFGCYDSWIHLTLNR